MDTILEAEERRYRPFGDTGSVVILDLDRLKAVNDQFGHYAGDRHLQKAAAVLRAHVRGSDVLARLGGDEFGVLVATTAPQQTPRLADQLQQQLDQAGTPTSVGSRPYTTAAAGFPGAWRQADEAMHQQKNETTTHQLTGQGPASIPAGRPGSSAGAAAGLGPHSSGAHCHCQFDKVTG